MVLDGKFVVGRALGDPGGFGITYIGWDINLEMTVAIKEFLPRDLAGRETDKKTIYPHTEKDKEIFHYGLKQFVEEARTLAKFNHPNVVRVRTFFEENGTAYIVMDYYDGVSLAEYIKNNGGKIDATLAVDIMIPVLDGVREVHAKGFLHRDIKPRNIYLTEGGIPILLDFGTARFAIGERSRSLSVVLTPGYSPFEQYQRKGKQGPWTDIYACAATLYFMITGKEPPEASDRITNDELVDLDALIKGIPTGVNHAIMQALSMNIAERPQTIKEFQEILTRGQDEIPLPTPENTPKAKPYTVPEMKLPDPGPKQASSKKQQVQQPSKKSKKVFLWLFLSLLISGILIVTVIEIKRQADYKEFVNTSRKNFQDGNIASMLENIKRAKKIKESAEIKELENQLPPKVENIISKTKVITKNARGLWEASFDNGIEMVYISPGEFMMGSPPNETGRSKSEDPQHKVIISKGFWIGKYEVTIGQYLSFCKEKRTHFPVWLENGSEYNINDGKNNSYKDIVSEYMNDNRPIVGIGWNDANAYCQWLSKKKGLKFRLPTEAEWEFACRAGTTTPFHYGSSLSSEQANFDGNGPYGNAEKNIYRGKTIPVGNFKPNSWGLYDMHGNVYEWCNDWFDENYYLKSSKIDPSGPINRKNKTYRGGCWYWYAGSCRSAYRNASEIKSRSRLIGFRLSMESK